MEPIVNIYIATSFKTGRRNVGRYIYLLEFISNTGKSATKHSIASEDFVSANRIVLKALLEALLRLTRSCNVTVYTDSEYILNAFKNKRLYQWEIAGWRNAKNEGLVNADLWKQVLTLVNNQYINVINEPHSYYDWMIAQIGGM